MRCQYDIHCHNLLGMLTVGGLALDATREARVRSRRQQQVNGDLHEGLAVCGGLNDPFLVGGIGPFVPNDRGSVRGATWRHR